MKRKRKRKHQKKLKGIIHYCHRCKKRTEHFAEGERWVRYIERCKICKQINYSEMLRKNWKEK
jgi:hypothetical protein